MREHRISIPGSLAPKFICGLTRDLENPPDADRYVIDFAALRTTPPFGMLTLASAVRRLSTRCRLMGRNVVAENYEDIPYAAHMGLFTSFGLDFGKSPGQAVGSSTYIPISRLTLEELTRRAAGYRPLGDVVQDESQRIARLLLPGFSEFIQAQFSFCIREMMRNVVEHSEADELWYAGQVWPSRSLVEVAILDEGIGIKRSLEKHVKYRPASDADALGIALQRGTSSAVSLDPWGEVADSVPARAGPTKTAG